MRRLTLSCSITWLASFAIALGAGCQRIGPGAAPAQPQAANSAPPPKAGQSAASAEPTKSYKLVGVVVEVDRKAGEAKIRHEAIPGFMPAMTMSFPIKSAETLKELRPGDEVEGTLRVGATESELLNLSVTRPALGPPMTIDTSGGAPALKAKPTVLRPGDPVPDFAVTTQEGKPLRLSELRGNVVVLTFIYTRCPLPEFCPLIDRKFKDLADKLALNSARAKHVRLLSVSFDPEHDTPETLQRHARLKGAEPPLWTFAVASHEELQKVAPALGLSYLPGQNEIAHSLSTAVIDADGKLVRLETGRRWDPSDLFKTIYPRLPASRP